MRQLPHTATLALALLFGAGPALACEGRLIEDPGVLGVTEGTPLCLPADPARIVVVDPTFSLGMGLELGLPIVAAPLANMGDLALRDAALAAGVQDLGWLREPSLEALVAARPDLIIGSSMAEGFLPILSQIAPTVLISHPDWRDYYRSLAAATGRADRLEALFAPLEARIAEMRPRIPETTVSVLRITSWDFQVYLDQEDTWAPYALLRELGVRRSEYEQGPEPSGLRRPDWEELAGLDGEILLYIIGGQNPSATDGRWEEVSSTPLWQMLPAVAAGRVHEVSPVTWMEFSGIAAAQRVLDDVERLVIGTE